MKKSSITLSIAILALVFGFYMIFSTGCKESTDTSKTDGKSDTKDDGKTTNEEKSAVENASDMGKKFLLSKFGEKSDEGWGKMHFGMDAYACSALMSDPNPMMPTDEPLSEMIDFFLENQDSTGKWASRQMSQPVYETSLVIMALKRALDLKSDHSKMDTIKTAIKKGVDFLLLTQVDENPAFEGDVVVQPDEEGFNAVHRGGWTYGKSRPGKSPANLSTSHYALEALYESGLKDDPKVKEAFKKAIGFLEYCQNSGEKTVEIPVGIDKSTEIQKIKYANDGGGIYGPGIAKPGTISKDGYQVPISYGTMTYVLLKGYVFAGLSKTNEKVQAAFNWLKRAENFTFSKNPGYDEKPLAGLYYMFYSSSKALKLMGEDIIKDSKGEDHNWRDELQKQILKLQQENGSWKNSEPKWEEQRPVLATAYALTALGNTMK